MKRPDRAPVIVECPTCGAPIGEPCRGTGGGALLVEPCAARRVRANASDTEKIRRVIGEELGEDLAVLAGAPTRRGASWANGLRDALASGLDERKTSTDLSFGPACVILARGQLDLVACPMADFKALRLVIVVEARPGAIVLRAANVGPNLVSVGREPVAIEAFGSCPKCAEEAGHAEGGAYDLPVVRCNVPVRLGFENLGDSDARIISVRLLGFWR
jgi:hypothetical protein